MKRTLIHIHHTFWVTVVMLIALVAIVLTIARLVTPILTKERATIERWASTALAQPVEIGYLNVTWRNFSPLLKCEQVIIFNPEHTHPILQVDELDIGLNLLKTLLSGQLQLGNVRIAGVHLTVHHNPDGSFIINGIHAPLPTGITASTDIKTVAQETMAWLLKEPQIVLQNITLTWYTKNNKIIPINNLTLALNNVGNRHILSGEAESADKTHSQLHFILHLIGNLTDPKHMHGKIYIRLQNILLQQWFSDIAFGGFKIQQGLLNMQIWGVWDKHQLQRIQSEISLKNMNIVNQKTRKILAMPTLNGNLLWQHRADSGWQLLADAVRLTFKNHEWPREKLAIIFMPSTIDHPAKQIFQASYLHLPDIIPLFIASDILPKNFAAALSALQPKGDLENFIGFYEPNASPVNFVINAKLKNISLTRWEHIPGVTNLNGELQLTPTTGALHLASQNMQLDFGKLFRAPLLLDSVASQIRWQKIENEWQFIVKQLAVQNADIRANATMNLQIPTDNESPTISLLSGFQMIGAQHISYYLPLTVLSPGLVHWLDTAITQTQSVQGTLVINGALHDFPYDEHKGTFIIDSQITDADIVYFPKWPPVQHFSGELIFAERSMDAIATQAEILGTSIKQLTAEIPVIKKEVPAILRIDSALDSTLPQGFNFLRQSPLQHLLRGALSQLQAKGPLQLVLHLQIPLEKYDELPLKVNGTIITQEAILALPQWNWQFENVSGQLNFTENSLTGKDMTATLWNKPVSITFSSPKPDVTQITLTGNLALKDLQDQFKNSFLMDLTGNANYRANLIMGNQAHGDRLQLSSDLKGVAINLPKPLAKSASESVPFNLNLRFATENNPQQLLIRYRNLWLSIGERINAWLIGVTGANIKGQITLPKNKQNPIQANLQYLYLDDTELSKSHPWRPEDIPAINFNCQDLRYGDKRFGTIGVNLMPIANGLRVNNLRANSAAFTLQANGVWYSVQGGTRTEMQGEMSSQNIAAALTSLGLPSGVSGKQGNIKFDLRWVGAPYDPHFENVTGQLTLALKQGEIVNVGTGAATAMKMSIGRLLTLTSWQSLERRLRFDFSDLTTQNFSFDIFKGDFILQNGNALTQNAYLDGPMAAVSVKGRVGLVAEDYDLQLGITPHVSSSLSLLAGFAGGPVVGVATTAAAWMANKLLHAQMQKITVDTYNVTGPWSKPNVQKVSGL